MTADTERITGGSEGQAEGLVQALALLQQCRTEHGFVATPTSLNNYRRIWARDGCIIGLAALISGDPELINVFGRTLRTLAKYQGIHGEIPSNVDPRTNRVSYGGTTGRVDADLWFLIGCAEYLRETGDEAFLDDILEAAEAVAFLLGAWEFNDRGLLFVPPTGDWADEYIQSGYVLYDQLLYLQAKRALGYLHWKCHGSRDHQIDESVGRLRELIRANYWLTEEASPEYTYHKVLFERGRQAAQRRHHAADYWLPFFSPTGYGYRFDAFANVLVSLFGVADEEHTKRVDAYIQEHVIDRETHLLPAFLPVIAREDEGWHKLQVSYSHKFKNQPYEYHNGGLWPMVTGFYAAGLAQRGQRELAEQIIGGIHSANRSQMGDEEWGFPEFLHGQKHTPGGTCRMGWSAAGPVIARGYQEGRRLFEFPESSGRQSDPAEQQETG